MKPVEKGEDSINIWPRRKIFRISEMIEPRNISAFSSLSRRTLTSVLSLFRFEVRVPINFANSATTQDVGKISCVFIYASPYHLRYVGTIPKAWQSCVWIVDLRQRDVFLKIILESRRKLKYHWGSRDSNCAHLPWRWMYGRIEWRTIMIYLGILQSYVPT